MVDFAITKRYSESAQGDVIQGYNVADVAVEKGILMSLQDGREASKAITQGIAIAGISAREKIALDSTGQVSLYKKGYFDVVASGAIGVGQPLIAEVDNCVRMASATASGAQVIGYSEETTADNEDFIMRLDL